MMSPLVCSKVLRQHTFSNRRTQSHDHYLLNQPDDAQGDQDSLGSHDDFIRNELKKRKSQRRLLVPVPKLNLMKAHDVTKELVHNQNAKKKGPDGGDFPHSRPVASTYQAPDAQKGSKQQKIEEFIKLTKEKDKYLILYQSEREKNVKLRQEIQECLKLIEQISKENEKLIAKNQENNELINNLNQRVKFYKELYAKYMALMSSTTKVDKATEIDNLIKTLMKKFNLTVLDLDVTSEATPHEVDDSQQRLPQPPLLSPTRTEMLLDPQIPPSFRDHRKKGRATVLDIVSARADPPALLEVHKEEQEAEPTITLNQAKTHLVNMARELDFISSLPVSELTKRYLASLESKNPEARIRHRRSNSEIASLVTNVRKKSPKPREANMRGSQLLEENLLRLDENVRRGFGDPEFDVSQILNTTNVNVDFNGDLSLIIDK